MSDEVRKLIERADNLDFQGQWQAISFLNSASHLSRLNGKTLMCALAEYFGKDTVEEVLLKEGEYRCPNCKRVFTTQQGLVGHGPNRCKKIV